MFKNVIKNGLPYIVVILGFIAVSLAYFSPVLQGKKILQSDIVQYIGMAKQQIDFRETTGEEMYWTDRAFGGMPTYQSGALYPNNYIKKIDRLVRFLPRPADYLFLYFLGFFVLLKCFKVGNTMAFFGSLAFGFSTYLIIILGVGHNAKAHAIGYMPLVLSGVLLTYRNKYILGGLLFTIAMALELVANHFQMTYYLAILLLIVALTHLFYAYRTKKVSAFFKASGILVAGTFLAVGLNATSILATKEYSNFSTRGASEISIAPGGKEATSNGLEKDYILSYSYGILETFNLLIPRFMGGSSAEDAGKDAKIVKELVKMGYPVNEARKVAKTAPTYWGDQPYIGAPAYIGAGVLFLFVLSIFFVDSKTKWWVVGASVLALMLSWGKNLEWFSDLFINFFPLYSKFRAVTSIQVILELCIPFFAVYGLYKFLSQSEKTESDKLKILYKATGVVGGLLLIFVILKNILFSFSNAGDAELIKSAGMQFVSALREDRKRLFTIDTIRSLVFVLGIAAALWALLSQKITQNIAVIIIGVLLVSDVVLVARRYVNTDDFVNAVQMDRPFTPTAADTQILQDTTHFRVYDLTVSPFNSARTSYFHNAVGGYHGAKPQRMQQLFDFYISAGFQPVLDMLNVKYFIFEGEEGVGVQENPRRYGNAWFVNTIQKVPTANDEILALKTADLKNTAVVNTTSEIAKQNFNLDSTASIKLIAQKPHELVYAVQNKNEGFGVFSEMYYKNGWQALVDGVATPIVKTNYALRGIVIPAGTKKVEFKFDPQVVKTGSFIALISFILLLFLVGAGIWYTQRKRN